MTLPARFSLLHSDLNDFLFASVGVEQNGMPLSVVSALTRVGVDPWEEAAQLAALPKALAAKALEPMIARSPISRPKQLNNLALSQRLVELLPARGQTATPGRERADAKNKYFYAVMLLACLALGAAAIWGIP